MNTAEKTRYSIHGFRKWNLNLIIVSCDKINFNTYFYSVVKIIFLMYLILIIRNN